MIRQLLWKTVCQWFKKLNIKFTTWTRNSSPRNIYTKKEKKSKKRLKNRKMNGQHIYSMHIIYIILNSYLHIIWDWVLKSNGVVTHAITWMNLEDIIVSEKTVTQKEKYVISPIWNPYNRQIIKRESRFNFTRGSD